MTVSTENRQKIIQLVEQLPEESLTEVIELLNSLHERTSQAKPLPSANSEEKLLQIIHRKISQEDQDRLDYLRQLNENGDDMTAAEYQELLAFVSRIEKEDAERVSAIFQLAQIRKVDPLSLITKFAPQNRDDRAIR
ncbi:hypothetical protein HCU40_06440 [Pseudanabaena biceps]|nr:hypothetical protein [Pseudanabaena biceps]